MFKYIELICSACIVLACLFLGGGIQILLWKTPDNTYLDALLEYDFMWFVYMIVSILIVVQALRLLNIWHDKRAQSKQLSSGEATPSPEQKGDK